MLAWDSLGERANTSRGERELNSWHSERLSRPLYVKAAFSIDVYSQETAREIWEADSRYGVNVPYQRGV